MPTGVHIWITLLDPARQSQDRAWDLSRWHNSRLEHKEDYSIPANSKGKARKPAESSLSEPFQDNISNNILIKFEVNILVLRFFTQLSKNAWKNIMHI